MKKKLCLLTAFILALSLLSLPAFAVVDKSEDFYVADYASVLSEETKQVIIDTNGYLEQNCSGAQIVVVTIEYLDTYQYSDEYANYLFNSWGVGDNSENNGMLLLLVTEEGKGWLSTGSGISGEFDDDTANEYLDDYFWDEFDRGNYDAAVSELFAQLVYWYEDEYGTEGGFDQHYNPNPGGGRENGDSYRPSLFQSIVYFFLNNLWIVMFIIIIIINIYSDRRRYYAYYRSTGVPVIPPYHFWYFWGGPHRHYRGPGFHDHHDHDDDHHGPFGGGGFGGGGFGGFGGGSGFGGGGFSGGGGGGRR